METTFLVTLACQNNDVIGGVIVSHEKVRRKCSLINFRKSRKISCHSDKWLLSRPPWVLEG
jgi:hypothetical protein